MKCCHFHSMRTTSACGTWQCHRYLWRCPRGGRSGFSWGYPDVWVQTQRCTFILSTFKLTGWRCSANLNCSFVFVFFFPSSSTYLNNLSLISRVSTARASAAFSTWATLWWRRDIETLDHVMKSDQTFMRSKQRKWPLYSLCKGGK